MKPYALFLLVLLFFAGCANVQHAAAHPTKINERQYEAAKAKFEGPADPNLPGAPPMKRL
jgi:hypothetical protein